MMHVQDLADIFGLPADLLEETGTTNYSELRAKMLEERQRWRKVAEAVGNEINRNIIEPLAQYLLERVISTLILEIESDQHIKGFDTTGYL